MTMAVPEKAPPDEFMPIRSAFDILKQGAATAAHALVDIAAHGKSEMARMYAAQAVLDRVGLPAKVDIGVTAVHLHGQGGVAEAGSAAVTVAERLRLLRQQQQQQQLTLTEDGVVVQFPGGGGGGGDDDNAE